MDEKDDVGGAADCPTSGDALPNDGDDVNVNDCAPFGVVDSGVDVPLPRRFCSTIACAFAGFEAKCC